MPKRENRLSNYFMSSVVISESFRSYMSKIFKDDILRSKAKFAHVCSLFACFALRFTKVVAHQHLPIFHTEHCVFCRFLSNGNDYTDPGSCTYATLKVHMSKIYVRYSKTYKKLRDWCEQTSRRVFIGFVLGSQSPFQSSRENRTTESDLLNQNQKTIYTGSRRFGEHCYGGTEVQGLRAPM